ncbi:MAG: HEPN domain-containing protein [Acidobacteriaceae bacterium]|nr:HEPN domain-containing protein [Acidobacteriaceae bacterium]
MNRAELQELSRIRFSEAKSLLRAGFADGAYYLAGYSVECGLKACIAKSTRRFDFPDKTSVEASHTHNLKDLVKVANLEVARLEQAKTDPGFRNSWDLVQQWSEQSRYRRHERNAAIALLEAVGNGKHGVLSWIKRHW